MNLGFTCQQCHSGCVCITPGSRAEPKYCREKLEMEQQHFEKALKCFKKTLALKKIDITKAEWTHFLCIEACDVAS